VNYTVAGTATLGGDYTGIAATPATKTVTFAAGAPTATVTVRPTADTIAEANETISLTLKAATGYRIGTPTAVSGTLLNDDITSTTSTTLGSTGSSLLLLGNKPINGTGNGRNNTLTGNSSANRLKGLGGADVLTGGGNKDRDVFAYTALNDSLLRAGDGFDRITDFNRNDRLSVPRTMRPQQLSSSRGTAASLTAPAIAAVLTPANFAANSVAAFQVSGRVGTFIAMNDGRPGFQAQSDGLLFLRNYAISGTNSVAFVA
jgi:Ca2+-binding RTX toxin-like protein